MRRAKFRPASVSHQEVKKAATDKHKLKFRDSCYSSWPSSSSLSALDVVETSFLAVVSVCSQTPRSCAGFASLLRRIKQRKWSVSDQRYRFSNLQGHPQFRISGKHNIASASSLRLYCNVDSGNSDNPDIRWDTSLKLLFTR